MSSWKDVQVTQRVGSYTEHKQLQYMLTYHLDILGKKDGNSSLKLQTRMACFAAYLCGVVAAFQGQVSG